MPIAPSTSWAAKPMARNVRRSESMDGPFAIIRRACRRLHRGGWACPRLRSPFMERASRKRPPRASSLDHLVGAGEERGRDRETEGVSGFEVHHELKPGGKQASPSRSG